MEPGHRTGKAARLEHLVHFLTAFTITMKGLSKFEDGSKYWPYAAFFVVAGVLIALGAVFHHRIERRFPYFKAGFYLMEALVLTAVAWLQQKDGTSALHLVTYAAAALYLVAAMIFVVKRSSHAKRAQSSL